VRFLVDAQLPPALARWLSTQGHEAEHVVDLGLAGAKDRAIWTHAAETGVVIVTKDEDFVSLSTLSPNGPPVVWIRLGNTTRSALLAWFSPLFPDIERALAAGEKLVEVTR
jgi:predicted nuclease of predicted toxin-antitoxin system